MTPNKRAEKINRAISGFHSPLDRENFIAAEIQAAVDEAFKEFLPRNDALTTNMIRHFKVEAYEDAAKIAESKEAGKLHRMDHPMLTHEIARMIRAKANEFSGKSGEVGK